MSDRLPRPRRKREKPPTVRLRPPKPRTTKLKYCYQEDFDNSVGCDGVAVSQSLISGAIAWGLKCPKKWVELRDLYDKCMPEYRTIPEFPPGYGARWMRVILDVWKWYRPRLAEIRPVDTDADRWESFTISYMAIMKLAETAQHQEIPLVYTACKNDHINYLQKLRTHSAQEIPDDLSVCAHEIPTDLRLDLEMALSKLPPREAVVARLRLLDDLDWDSIASVAEMSARHARRLYSEAQQSLRDSLGAYENPSKVT